MDVDVHDICNIEGVRRAHIGVELRIMEDFTLVISNVETKKLI